jgi:large subunit ribosomal protein L1
MTILENIKKVRESKKRNFNQTFDLIINLKELDLKKAENKIDEHFTLPKGSGKEASITLFSDSAKKIEGCKIIKGGEIESLGKKKKDLKKVIKETDFFLSEPKLMPVVGKHLGKYLAPRGMMPKPVAGDVNKVIEGTKKSVKIKFDKQPIIHTIVGSEKMDDKDIEENIKALLTFLQKKLPRGKNNIKSVYLKTTMGHPIKIEAG